MKADLERYQKRQAPSGSIPTPGAGAPAEPEQEGAFKATVDKILIADFFLVLLILAWLGAGVLQAAVQGSSPLLDAWYPLWPLLWQPAIGVLMAGALVSGGIGWLQEQQKK